MNPYLVASFDNSTVDGDRELQAFLNAKHKVGYRLVATELNESHSNITVIMHLEQKA